MSTLRQLIERSPERKLRRNPLVSKEDPRRANRVTSSRELAQRQRLRVKELELEEQFSNETGNAERRLQFLVERQEGILSQTETELSELKRPSYLDFLRPVQGGRSFNTQSDLGIILQTSDGQKLVEGTASALPKLLEGKEHQIVGVGQLDEQAYYDALAEYSRQRKSILDRQTATLNAIRQSTDSTTEQVRSALTDFRAREQRNAALSAERAAATTQRRSLVQQRAAGVNPFKVNRPTTNRTKAEGQSG